MTNRNQKINRKNLYRRDADGDSPVVLNSSVKKGLTQQRKRRKSLIALVSYSFLFVGLIEEGF